MSLLLWLFCNFAVGLKFLNFGIMAMKYCEQHGIWYDYNEGCPECGKFGRIAGSIIGNIIGGGIWATVTAARKIKEHNKRQKEIKATCITATIIKVWQEHNIVRDGNLGMNIHVKFEVNNMLNMTGLCAVYFYDKNKTPLMDTNGSYCAANGQVAISEKYIPNYQNCTFNDFVLFFPYSELHLLGHHNISFQIIIFDFNTTNIATSYFYDFYIDWQESTRTKTMSNKKSEQINYPDIKSIIQKVINYAPNGEAIISIGDLYVQFFCYDNDTLIFEAVSDFYVPRIGNKDKEFKKMGFRKVDNNFSKEYSTNNITLIINDIVEIFENIYKVNFFNYIIDDNC